MADAIPYRPIVLDAVGEKTDWMDIAAFPDGSMFIAKVSGTVTYVFEIANDELGTVQADKSDSLVSETFTADAARIVPGGPGMPAFGRHRITAGTGSVTIGWGKSKDAAGNIGRVTSVSRIT